MERTWETDRREGSPTKDRQQENIETDSRSYPIELCDSYPISCKLLGVLSGVDGDLLERQYRNHLSGYLHWDQLVHAEDWLYSKRLSVLISVLMK